MIEESPIFDNQYVLSRIEENKNSKQSKVIEELKQIAPLLNDEKLLELYNKSISIHQSKIQGNGDFLENDILVGILDKHNISYKKQVTIDETGKIVGFNEKRKIITCLPKKNDDRIFKLNFENLVEELQRL